MYISSLYTTPQGKIYYKQRPAWSDFREDTLIKFDGDFWWWSRFKKDWIKDTYLFKECQQGHMERITDDEAMKMIEEMK